MSSKETKAVSAEAAKPSAEKTDAELRIDRNAAKIVEYLAKIPAEKREAVLAAVVNLLKGDAS